MLILRMHGEISNMEYGDIGLSSDPLAGLSTAELAKQPVQVKVEGEGYRESEARKDAEANRLANDSIVPGTQFIDTVQRTWNAGGNIGYSFIKDLQRRFDAGDADPGWEPDKFIEANKNRIPDTQMWRYMLTNNASEANAMLTDAEMIQREQDIIGRRGTFSALAAGALVSIVDVDTPLTIASGGLSASAKLGLNASKWGRMVAGAAAGGLVGAGSQWIGYHANPEEDYSSIAIAGLAGMGFGTLGGSFAKGPEDLANAARNNVINEVGETLNDGAPLAKRPVDEPTAHDDPFLSDALRAAQAADEAAPEPKAPEGKAPATEAPRPLAERVEDVEIEEVPDFTLSEGRSTVGARQLGQSGPDVAAIKSTRIAQIISNSQARIQQLGISADWFANTSNLHNMNDAVGRAVARFQDFVNSTPLATDFTRMMRSGSAVAQYMAYELMENASGIIRNNRSAAALQEHYFKQLQGAVAGVQDDFSDWATRSKGAKWIQQKFDFNLRKEFNEAVISELQARAYDAPNSVRNIDPAIKRAADRVDEWSKREIEIGKGRPGEGSVKGYDILSPRSGYFMQRWSGRNLRALMKTGKSEADIVEAAKVTYMRMHPGMDPKYAKIWAQAAIDRALRQDEGMPTNLLGILQEDGADALEDLLKRNGVSAGEARTLIDNLLGASDTRAQAGHTKQRIDVDMRMSVNGIRIMDMFDTDIDSLIAGRSRRSSGMAALARKGIYSKSDWEDIKKAIMQEQKANGENIPSGTGVKDRAADFVDKDRHLSEDDIDAIYSYFTGGAAKGYGPIVSRIRKITNLALLNQLGLTQMAEFGPMIAAVGVKEFLRRLPDELHAMTRNADSDLVKELKHMNVFVPEERIFRDDLVFEYESAHAGANEFMAGLDNLLNKGQRLQGYTSLFYQVRQLQQRIAVTSAADKVMTHLKNGTGMSPDRLLDIGVDANLATRLQHYISSGVVEFQGGNLRKLNLDQWDPIDAENFTLALNRSTNQLVQKAMIGESNILFHKSGVAALFGHLKIFPLLAFEKQTIRNARLADSQALGTFAYGLTTAAMAYIVKQTVNGSTENLTADKIARNAFGMSNMTGWIPMWTDPLAGMLGMDDLKFNAYAKYGDLDVLSAPAALNTSDRLLKIPGALLSLGDFSLTNGEIRSLQTMPIIGNAYGWAAMFNAMKD